MSFIPPALVGDTRLVKIAREIAIDHFPIEEVMKRFGVTQHELDELKSNPRFVQLLQSEIEAWESATNTHERVKFRAASAIEEWLLEAGSKLHDPKETLNAKTELAKLLARLAGMGIEKASVEGSTERFSVVIKIGDDKSVKLESTTPRVIDHEPA